MTIEIVYCKHGYRGNCPFCGAIIVMRWPVAKAYREDTDA